jgi:hypothetical protein
VQLLNLAMRMEHRLQAFTPSERNQSPRSASRGRYPTIEVQIFPSDPVFELAGIEGDLTVRDQ